MPERLVCRGEGGGGIAPAQVVERGAELGAVEGDQRRCGARLAAGAENSGGLVGWVEAAEQAGPRWQTRRMTGAMNK